MKCVVPRGLEPRTLRLLAVRSNQLSYETIAIMVALFTNGVKTESHAQLAVHAWSALKVPSIHHRRQGHQRHRREL